MPEENSEMELDAWFTYIKQHEKRIFVRVDGRGNIGAFPLSEITPEQWGEYLAGWLIEGCLPVYVRDSEMD